ncbi:glycosyltransferase family 4 protein [Aliiroseovarius sp. S253]|uniref:glycosyltransferase family 4 protein n=1 Tax=Aliiroseovarius sp. S253 TaxID=3415133 RepID=UPI003C7DEEB4
MRVLFIQGGFGTGGAEKVIAMIANHRVAQGDEVEVAAMRAPKDGTYYNYSPDVRLTVLEPDVDMSAPANQMRRLRQVRRLIRDRKPDVVVSFLTKINVLTLVAGMGRRVPIVISERNNPGVQNNHPVWKKAAMLLGPRASAIVTLTERGRDQLPSKLHRRAHVIPNPCTPMNGSRNQKKSRATDLVAVGRLDWQKGFDLLMQSLAKLRETHPDINLTIFGEGPERPSLERLRSELELDGVVSMPGTTQKHGAWLGEGDIVVVTSRYEGFCNVVAEATLSGVPIVSFDCEFGPREMIQHEVNGLLVQTGNVEELTESLRRLIENAELRQGMAQAANLNKDYLDPDRILGDWDRVINSAVKD